MPNGKGLGQDAIASARRSTREILVDVAKQARGSKDPPPPPCGGFLFFGPFFGKLKILQMKTEKKEKKAKKHKTGSKKDKTEKKDKPNDKPDKKDKHDKKDKPDKKAPGLSSKRKVAAS